LKIDGSGADSWANQMFSPQEWEHKPERVTDMWNRTAPDFNLLVHCCQNPTLTDSKHFCISFKSSDSQGEETLKVINPETNGKERSRV